MAGLDDGGGTVTVNPSNNSGKLAVSGDPMCREVGGGDFECTLGSDSPKSLNLMVFVEEGAPSTQFAVEVKPAAGVVDADPTINAAATTLMPRAPAA